MRPRASSIVAIVVRRSWVAWCMLIVLVAEVSVLFTRGAPWRGDLVWTIDWFGISHVIVGPVIAGCVAVDAARFAAGMKTLPIRGWRSPVGVVVGVYALAVWAVHLTVLCAVLLVWSPPDFEVAALLAVAAQLLMFTLYTAIGAVVARFATPYIAGAVAALIAAVAVFTLSSPGSSFPLLAAGGATVPRIGYQYDVPWLTVQCLALILVSAGLLLVGPATSRVRKVTLVGAAGVGLSVALVAVSVAPDDRLAAVAVEPPSCGALATVPWCYFPEHERVIDGYASTLLALFGAAEEAGYQSLVPESVVQSSQATWPGDETTGTFYVTSDVLGGASVNLWDVTAGLVEPLHCPQTALDEPPGERYWQDLESLTYTWISLVDAAAADSAGPRGQILAPDEAAQIVGEFRTCTHEF